MPAAGLYFDSALIAKFYLNEPGRDAVRDLARSAGAIVTSAIAVAEVSAAFHRKLRESAVGADSHKALQAQFAHDLGRQLWSVVPVSNALLEQVQTFLSGLDASVFVRSLDALHLMTAREEGFADVYSNDRRLLAASASAGLRGINPLS